MGRTIEAEQLERERSILNFWIAMEALNPQSFKDRKLDVDVPDKSAATAEAPKKAPIPFDLSNPDLALPWLSESQTPKALGLRPASEHAKGQTLSWQIPLGFIDLAKAEKVLSEHFDALSDDETERQREPASGWGVLAVAELDAQGKFKEKSVAISSFGWACGMVLSGHRDRLHTFSEEEADICQAIEYALLAQDEKGWKKSTGRQQIVRTMNVMLEKLKLTDAVKILNIQQATHVVRKIVSDDEDGQSSFDGTDILNSFHLRELSLVRDALPEIESDSPLAKYLGRIAPTHAPIDPLAERSTLEKLTRPGLTPIGRWPSPDPIHLVTLQQSGVNAIFQSLEGRGLSAINGPPGTGKTTLLRDLVAGVIVQRAICLSEFENPSEAFTYSGTTISQGSYQFRVQCLSEKLRGFGIIVASENNEAVRNISREFPAVQSVRSKPGQGTEPEVEYFRYLSNGLLTSQDSWGLCAAELGNVRNCSRFVSKVWWNRPEAKKPEDNRPMNGLMVYLKDMFARKHPEGAEIFASVEAPKNEDAARSAWRTARRKFDDAVTAARQHQSVKATARELVVVGAELEDKARLANAEIENAKIALGAVLGEISDLDMSLDKFSKRHADYGREIDMLKGRRSGIIQKVFPPPNWKSDHEEAFKVFRESRDRLDKLEDEKEALIARKKTIEKRIAVAKDAAESIRREFQACEEADKLLKERGLSRHADPLFWSGTRESIHTASPWSDEASRRAADEVFYAAIGLHKAFIDASRHEIRQNLAVIMAHINGRSASSDAAHLLGDLWDTFFLLTPLYSTTFASAGRMLRNLDADTIGWLLIDEAGQAAPQSAAGALLRARRAVVIGDPLQIEPVVTLPEGIKRSLASSYNLVAEDWAGPEASCQTLADRVSDYQADIDGKRVGFPLLVHRRCDDPMFSISNEIAYGGQMVHATYPGRSKIREALSPGLTQSCWLHVDSRAKKWNREEGTAAAEILLKLFHSSADEPDIYFISPFREVVKGLKDTLVPIAQTCLSHMPASARGPWINARIGTIHTFQGKEAEAVCLVLGASAESSRGSRVWAGRSPNILNVAVTRAKRLLIVIGHHEAWKDAGVFGAATDTSRLPRVDYVKGELYPNLSPSLKR